VAKTRGREKTKDPREQKDQETKSKKILEPKIKLNKMGDPKNEKASHR
jgi:hypothetical protein